MSSSLLGKLSLDDWERIAFYTVASESTFLGPPTALCALSLSSRHVHDSISVKNNSRLYARIFRFKFDYAAPARRLTDRWLTSRCLAKELIARFTVLRRIRWRREFRSEDLWTCYLMMSESDGKNESQLLDWAGLKEYLEVFAVARMHLSTAWNVDLMTSSLAIWLLWMTISRANIQVESLEHNRLMLRFVHSFVVAGYRAPSIYGPDSYFNIPLCERLGDVYSHSGPSPPHLEITYFSHKITLATPIVTSAAVLITTVRTESLQDSHTFPAAAYTLPADRATANASNLRGPTLEDLYRFHFQERIHIPVQCTALVDTNFSQAVDEDGDVCDDDATPSHGSRRYDEDWSRLVACHDPHASESALRGKVFTLGSLTGSWKGRLLLPDFRAHINVVLDPHLSPLSVPLQHKPLYWTLREHHCLIPDEPLDTGLSDMGDEDFLNAWLPRGIDVKSFDDAIEVFNPATNSTTRYETFLPNSSTSYHKSACEKLARSYISGSHEDLENDHIDAGDQDSMTYIDDDGVYEDVACHLSSGVRDILVTGETAEHHGDAWGNFTIIGRVRPWDGLIVLLRSPRDPDQAYLGEWMFKGYIHDRNLVGRWRERSTPFGMVGFEGGFVVSKEA